MIPILTTLSQLWHPENTEIPSPSISLWGRLRLSLFAIDTDEATFARRGFQAEDSKVQQYLEQIGHTFLVGYHSAIALNEPTRIIPQLNTIERELRGFAFEGAAMGLSILDYLTPWNRSRIEHFLAEAGGNHIYMVYVGMGWALARLPGSLRHYLAQLNSSQPQGIDPLLGWLALDGYGFHQGYFAWHNYVQGIAIPEELSGYACRVFDQGLGRSLWFVKGTNVLSIAQTIQNFPPNRRADLWSGVGLACTYAGGVGKEEVGTLKQAAQGYTAELAQGAAFAAKTRLRAGNLAEHTEMACQVLSGMSAASTAAITDQELVGLTAEGNLPIYEVWRKRIQSHFLRGEVRL